MSITGGLIGLFVTFSLSVTFTIFANMFVLVMIGEINRKRTDAQQIPYFGFHVVKLMNIFTEYRQLYPAGRLHILAIGSLALAMCSLLLFAWQFGFFT